MHRIYILIITTSLILSSIGKVEAFRLRPCQQRPECGVDNNGELFPDYFNCQKFYQCDNGVAVSKDCPSGLHFNDGSKECDWPSEAKCEECSLPTTTTTTPEPTTTTTPEPTTTTSTTTKRPTTTTTLAPYKCDVHQFTIGFTRVDWRTAELQCRNMAKVLVSIHSQQKYECVLRVISLFGGNHPPTANYWTGANDLASEGDFVWVATGAPVTTFFPIGNPQPDNYGGNEHCVSMRKVFPGGQTEDKHVMNDEECDLKFDYVCEYRGNS